MEGESAEKQLEGKLHCVKESKIIFTVSFVLLETFLKVFIMFYCNVLQYFLCFPK